MCWHIDNQYYFGADFLVSPIMNSENKRDVYLPEGNWVNFFTGDQLTGNRWLNDVEVALEDMPVWVKYGAQIPLYPEPVNCTDEMDLQKSISIEINNDFKGIWKYINI
jgi:alpha-D-xyloside xylohydrolase